MYTAFDIIMIPLQLLIIFFTLYYFLFLGSACSARRRKLRYIMKAKPLP